MIYESDIARVLPHSDAENNRYYAVEISSGNWLIDIVENKLSWLGTGILAQWNQLDELVIWQTAQQQTSAYYIGVDLP